MKTLFLCMCLIGGYVCGPDRASGQESLLVKTIKGHTGIIYSAAFSPDGKHIVSGGVDKTLKIWNVEDGACVKTLQGHKDFVNAVAFSPDGGSIASASEDGAIKLWNAESGACAKTLKGHKDSVWSVAYFPDGKRVVSGGADGTVRFWRADSGAPDRTLKAQPGYVYSVAVSSDGKDVASAGAGRIIKLWDAESGAWKRDLEGHLDSVTSLAFSKSGDYLASGSDDGTVKIWRLEDGLCVKTFTAGRRAILSVAYSPDDAYVFSGGRDGLVSAWRLSDGMLIRTFSGHGGPVKSVAFSPDGKYIASGSFDKTIKLWLTPWEAERRENEVKRAEALEAENNANFDAHYAAGLRLLSSPKIKDLQEAVAEFGRALSYKPEKNCEEKLKEAGEALRRKEEERKRLAIKGAFCLLAALMLLTVLRSVSRAKKKARLRELLPEEIKREALSGSYENGFKLYARYKEIGGDPRKLSQQALLLLYQGLQAVDELAKENIPYEFLLAYAVGFSLEGNNRVALGMLRSGRLADELKKSEEYDAFVDVFEKAHRPENLLMIKLQAKTYSGLAEAFLKVKDYDYCEKMCDLKKQFHAAEISPRDNELAAACRAGRAQPR